MEFLGGVALIAASIYYGLHGHPTLSGVLGGVGVVTMAGGLWRRQTGKIPPK